MYQYPYIEKFYQDNYSKLLSWSSPLRPSKSCPKNGAAAADKFKEFYLKTRVTSFTEDEVLTILNAENVEDGDTIFHQNLRMMRELNFVISSNEGGKKYVFTDNFFSFVESNHSVDCYIIEKMMSIMSVEDLTMYFNFLICVMREAAIYGQVILYPDAAAKFEKVVPDVQKQKEHQARVYAVYGFKGDEARQVPQNYTPNVSYFCHAALKQLGILRKTDNKIDNMGTLELTPLGELILNKIEENLKYGKQIPCKKNLFVRHIDIKDLSLQQIYYGAPGTGKSHAVKAVSNQYPDTIRTTFHPDSDYASFVGAYKPTVAMEKLYDEAGMPVKVGGQELAKNQITYKFVKQAFLKAYVKAWKKFQKAEDASHVDSQFLVIEEINRGNCAQIFGDLFQLLDRKNGFSEYPIEADEDIAKSLLDEDSPENPSFGKNGLQLAGWQKTYIENLFQKSKDKDVIVEKISMGKVLVLPCNLYIWATMNTSDQSLFPIDSAFKRRWDWKYVPINTKVKKWAIEVEGQKYSWTSFLDKMNEQIFNVTHSEDKKFGFFFCHADKKSDDTVEEEDVISAEKFVSKVIFFIYNDVFKDYGFDRKIFAGEDGKPIQFHEYYRMDGSVDESKVKKFLENVEVKPFEAEQAEEVQK